jgi:hypothetical protein
VSGEAGGILGNGFGGFVGIVGKMGNGCNGFLCSVIARLLLGHCSKIGQWV